MRIGELFSGYGGLGMGVQSVLGGDIAWHSDIDKGACKILAHRYPDVPNLGDITTVDWSQVEPVDVLTGGFPCQDVSAAGRRAGIRPGTRSGLWSQFAYAISQLHPRMVVIENVRGLLSAKAHSNVEPCPWCVGDDTDGTLRALGAVLGDLASLGFNAEWRGLLAADVGAPHGRFRVFIVATAGNADQPRLEGHRLDGERAGERAAGAPGAEPAAADAADLGHERPGRARDWRSGPADGRGGDVTDAAPDESLRRPAGRPTDAVPGVRPGHGDDAAVADSPQMQAAHGNGNGHGKSLSIEAQRLLPTPRTQNNENRQNEGYGGEDGNFYGLLHNPERWGDYAAAIARWETVLGRPAPAPTMTSAKGNPQLSPVFVEWMMGLPPGWVTDVPGITRNEALRALGNGVCPPQCAAALRIMLAQSVAA